MSAVKSGDNLRPSDAHRHGEEPLEGQEPFGLMYFQPNSLSIDRLNLDTIGSMKPSFFEQNPRDDRVLGPTLFSSLLFVQEDGTPVTDGAHLSGLVLRRVERHTVRNPVESSALSTFIHQPNLLWLA
jgi:hypothetical protein